MMQNKGERKKPTAIFVPKPPQLEATLMRARVLKLILLRSDLEKGDARFVSGWHKALSMSRLRFGYMLKSAAPATSESILILIKTKISRSIAKLSNAPTCQARVKPSFITLTGMAVGFRDPDRRLPAAVGSTLSSCHQPRAAACGCCRRAPRLDYR